MVVSPRFLGKMGERVWCTEWFGISFSLTRHPILYQCLFRFLVALILQQIYVQDGYPLRPMLISMGIIYLNMNHLEKPFPNLFQTIDQYTLQLP